MGGVELQYSGASLAIPPWIGVAKSGGGWFPAGAGHCKAPHLLLLPPAGGIPYCKAPHLLLLPLVQRIAVLLSLVPEESLLIGHILGLTCMQIVIAKIHFGLGGILLFSAKEFPPIIMNIWYPFWGGGLFFISGYFATLAATKPIEGLAAASHIFNTLSRLGAIAGTCILVIDLLKTFAVNLPKVHHPYMQAVSFLSQSILPLGCDGIFGMNNYCKVIKAYEIGIMCLMLYFTLLQMGTAFSTLHYDKNKQKKDKSRSHNKEQNVVLLSLPPQYSATEQNRYSLLPGAFHTSTFTEQPFDTATSGTCIG